METPPVLVEDLFFPYPSYEVEDGTPTGGYPETLETTVLEDMDSLVQLRNLDDLKKVLFLQKTITAQAKNELLAVISSKPFDPGGNVLEQAQVFMEEEKKLLTKYAQYPTLTEYQLLPNSYDGFKWGATFGVTLLVGEFIFEQLKMAHPHFTPVVRQLFVLFLSELDNPQHEYLIDPLEKSVKLFKITEEGKEVSPEKQKVIKRNLVNQFVETTVTLSEGYGIVKVKKGGVVITPLGKRLLLHLVDAAKFIEDMTQAHSKFQTSKPKLSMQ
jgi:hypothetical protein